MAVSVCLSVTALGATVFSNGHKVRYHRFLYNDFLDFNSLSTKKVLFWREDREFPVHVT